MRPNDGSNHRGEKRGDGGTGRDSGERERTNPRAESRLGVPRKQNGGERRARLGSHAIKRSRARENKEQKGIARRRRCDLNHMLATAASSWFHTHTRAELAEFSWRLMRLHPIWRIPWSELGLCVRPPNVVRSLPPILGCGPSRVYYAGIPAANGSIRGIESEAHAPEGFRFSEHWSHRLATQRCGDLPICDDGSEAEPLFHKARLASQIVEGQVSLVLRQECWYFGRVEAKG
jgi:hypothetical protein